MVHTFEVIHGVEGDCLVLDGLRIAGPKPWGGGTITKTFRADTEDWAFRECVLRIAREMGVE